MHWVDNADQHLVILPFSIKTVKGPRTILLPPPMYLVQCHHTLQDIHTSQHKHLLHFSQIVSKTSTTTEESDDTLILFSPTSFSKTQRTLTKDPPCILHDYMGKGRKIFCSTVLHIQGTKTPTTHCWVCKDKQISETMWFCHKCHVSLHPGMLWHEISHPENITTFSPFLVKCSLK